MQTVRDNDKVRSARARMAVLADRKRSLRERFTALLNGAEPEAEAEPGELRARAAEPDPGDVHRALEETTVAERRARETHRNALRDARAETREALRPRYTAELARLVGLARGFIDAAEAEAELRAEAREAGLNPFVDPDYVPPPVSVLEAWIGRVERQHGRR